MWLCEKKIITSADHQNIGQYQYDVYHNVSTVYYQSSPGKKFDSSRVDRWSTTPRCNWLFFSCCDWFIIFCFALLMCCFHMGPLLYGYSLVFLDRGQPCFWNFYIFRCACPCWCCLKKFKKKKKKKSPVAIYKNFQETTEGLKRPRARGKLVSGESESKQRRLYF